MAIYEAYGTVTLCQALFKYLTHLNSCQPLCYLPFIYSAGQGGEQQSSQLPRITVIYVTRCIWTLSR